MKSLLAKLTTLCLWAAIVTLQSCGSGCDGYWGMYKTTTTYFIATDSSTKILNIRYIGSDAILTPYMGDSSSYCKFSVSGSSDITLLAIETPGKTDTVYFITKLYENSISSSDCSSNEFIISRSDPYVGSNTFSHVSVKEYSITNPNTYNETNKRIVYRVFP